VRPAGGLPPDDFSRVSGMKAKRDIAVGEPITNDLVELIVIDLAARAANIA
jgi:sialic acid synthase SpsE